MICNSIRNSESSFPVWAKISCSVAIWERPTETESSVKVFNQLEMGNLLHNPKNVTLGLGCHRVCFLIVFLCLVTVFLIAQLLIVDSYYSSYVSIKISWRFGSRWKPRMDTLLNITDFKYVINPTNACRHSSPGMKNLLVVMIPSSRSFFESRSQIRSTWGSVRGYKNWSISRVFLLGTGTAGENATIQQQIDAESEIHSDIVLGNFVDTYKNMTYKHLMGYKWILQHCDHAQFILKSDDDIMVDIFAVVDDINNFLTASEPSNKYYCAKNVGVIPVRHNKTSARKWQVGVEEYPGDLYPPYCGFAAYLTTVPVIRSIGATAEQQSRAGQYLWIDDVYVTGIVREEYNRQNPVSGHISIVDIHEMYDWSWEITNATHKHWQSRLRFVVTYRGHEDGIMDIYWNQIKNIHFKNENQTE